MKKIDSIEVGDSAQLVHTITQGDIDQFVSLTGDDNRLHVDGDFARSTPFKKTVAHGMLGVSFISTVIGTKLPGDGALWYAQDIEFLLPVRVGDVITISAEVVRVDRRLESIELQTDIWNQNRQKVTSGKAKVKVIEPVAKKEYSPVDDNKVALVVGATGGMGKAISRQLAQDGFDMVLHYNRSEGIAQQIHREISEGGGKCHMVSGDISDAGSVEDMVFEIKRWFSGISVVVNCATSRIPNIPLSQVSWDDIQHSIDVNLKGVYNLQKHIVPLMECHKYGKFILFTSQAIEKPNPGWAHYITSKSALHGFAKSMALELAPKGILVNLISPGLTDTELVADLPEKVRLLTEAQTPLRRIATPEDVANTVSFLASEGSQYLTGETIRLNGGQVMI